MDRNLSLSYKFSPSRSKNEKEALAYNNLGKYLAIATTEDYAAAANSAMPRTLERSMPFLSLLPVVHKNCSSTAFALNSVVREKGIWRLANISNKLVFTHPLTILYFFGCDSRLKIFCSV
jgi:hypothetical protein